MSNVTIREAMEADLPEVLMVHAESGISHGDAFTVEEARTAFARLSAYPFYRVYVAVADGSAVGTYALIILDNLAKRGARAGVVEAVGVLPEFQSQGVGRAMMAHAIETCRAAGCYKMTLSSGLPREGAHRFYQALGFERHGYSFLIQL